MVTIDNLKITRFFDVKTPVGVNQRGESIDNYSIGVDLYFPRLSDAFITEFIDKNKKQYGKIEVIETMNENDEENLYFYSEKKKILMMVENYLSESNTNYTIYRPVTIPTGIGMLIPKNVWCEVRSKSGNFAMNFTEIHGTVDMNYTYGCGVQILPFDTECINFQADQKFTQLVFHEAIPIMKIEEILFEDWENLEEVQFKRQKRTGGFGHTGKFDK